MFCIRVCKRFLCVLRLRGCEQFFNISKEEARSLFEHVDQDSSTHVDLVVRARARACVRACVCLFVF